MTAGTVELRVQGDVVTLSPGDTLVVPAQTLHQLANVGEADAEWLLIAPAGIGFFHENSEQADPVWAR